MFVFFNQKEVVAQLKSWEAWLVKRLPLKRSQLNPNLWQLEGRESPIGPFPVIDPELP